jgi:hypothetical protein
MGTNSPGAPRCCGFFYAGSRIRKKLNAGRSALKLMNRVINVRPMVSLAAKFVGSGPNRLKMVKLSHELNNEAVQL